MGKEELRNRDTWQDNSGVNASRAEKLFYTVFKNAFKDTEFTIREKPKEFKDIYIDIELDEDTEKSIYHPEEVILHHGIIPDYAIDNIETNKTLYIEVKRQDGWVENKPRSAGRGNAHERACKLFTPGLLRILREHGQLGENVLPFWLVFQGDITRDPCRVREIHCWFGEEKNHFYLWYNENDTQSIVEHFNRYFKPLFF
jgi:hypothetical protein